MTTYTVPDGATEQSQQNGSPSDLYILGNNSTIVGAGAGIFFGAAAPSSSDVMYLTGISAQPGGYVGDEGVLGAGHATIVMGGINPTLFGGSGTADVFWSTSPATFVTGNEDANVIGDPTGAGISYTGGVASVQAFNGGHIVHENSGHSITLWAAGPTS